MSAVSYHDNESRGCRIPASARYVPMLVGLAAIAFTLLISAPELVGWRSALAAASALVFVAATVAATRRRVPARIQDPVRADPVVSGRAEQLNERLVALDEANEVFGSSLNAADMFRLVSSRVGEIFPFDASALLVPGEDRSELTFLHFDGINADAFRGMEIASDEGLAGASFRNGRIEICSDLSADQAALGKERLEPFSASAAIPMIHGDTVFGVFQIFCSEPIERSPDTYKLFEAISEHVTPIFRNSLEFERSLSKALTDAITGLPNERAFYMVLENQLAESQRNREERPITILSIDIRDFAAVNTMLGHAVGDRMLEFTGARISEQLRRMDFLARTVNDEFHVILPTASEAIGHEIVARIKRAFETTEFELSDDEGYTVELNIGWATFWKDGETPEELLRTANQRKRQAKSEKPAGVLPFPKEYVH
ncbi:MAG: GGDEF domain-containing protein [Chloracidobacterium sp.]|nr:GGDEF domain-containing protein [Chloracidobacterium sp.]